MFVFSNLTLFSCYHILSTSKTTERNPTLSDWTNYDLSETMYIRGPKRAPKRNAACYTSRHTTPNREFLSLNRP